MEITIVILAFVAFILIVNRLWKSPDSNLLRKGGFLDVSLFENNILITKIQGDLKIMALSMSDTQLAVGILSFVDKHGHLTDAASVEVASSDEAVFTASYDDPSNAVTATAVAPGVATLFITPKDSKGNILLFEDTAVEIRAGDALSGTIVFGEPTEQA